MSAADFFIFRFHNQAEPMKEAMINAGQALQMSAGRKAATILVSCGAALLMAGGGAVFMVFLSILLGLGIKNFMVPSLIGAALGLCMFRYWYNGLIRLMAQSILKTPFNQGMVEMRIDREGVMMITERARWHTQWSGIHKVVAGKQGLNIFLSGIALYVPNDAIEDPAEAIAQTLEEWRVAAS